MKYGVFWVWKRVWKGGCKIVFFEKKSKHLCRNLNENLSEMRMAWGFLFPLLDLRCIPALFLLRCIPALFLQNKTYSGAWKEKLSLGVRQGETASGKRSSPWERSNIRLSEPSPTQRAPTDTRSLLEDFAIDGRRRLWPRFAWRGGVGGCATPVRSLPLI